MILDKIFAGLNISAQGLSAQRRRMNTIAENMANVETTRTQEGLPYRRKATWLKAKTSQTFARTLQRIAIQLAVTNRKHMAGAGVPFNAPEAAPGGIEVQEVEDSSPMKLVYDPGHPDADENGYVKTPNVNIVTEMVDMISASRAYEANVVAINASKAIARDSLEI